MRERLTIGLLLIAATALVYAQTLGFEFVDFDDPKYLTRNPHLREGFELRTLGWALTTDYFGNWHPLTWLSYALDRELYGLEPAGYHATNVAFHVLNALLLFALLDRMTGRPWRSGLVAALFALHPLHVESVAWVSERKDVLSGYFGLLATAAYVAWARRGGVSRHLLVTLLLALGLASKPTLVTLPFAFLLLDYWPLARSGATGSAPAAPRAARALVLEKLPWMALAAGTAVITLAVQARGGARPPLDAIPLELRLANAAASYAAYLVQTVWPAGLACLYPHPYMSGGAPLGFARVAGSVALLLALTAAALRGRRAGYPLVGWLWFLGTLLPAIGIVPFGMHARADRYTYLPLIGLFLWAVWGGADLAERWTRGRVGLRRAGIAAVAAALLACGAASFAQARTWRDSISLFERALAVTRSNWTVHYNLANVLQREGRLDEAVEHYRAALRIAPHRHDVRFNLARALKERGEPTAAERQLRIVIALEPAHPKAHLTLGSLLLARGRAAEAEGVLRQAVAVRPTSRSAHRELAAALARNGRREEAAAHLREAVRLHREQARQAEGRAQ